MIVKNNPSKNFTIIPNEVIQSDISLQALAIYVKMRKHSQSWKLNIKAFAKECHINIKTFYKYLKELYENGLIQRVQGKDKNGLFTNEVAYIFTENMEALEYSLHVESMPENEVKSLQESIQKELENGAEESAPEGSFTEVPKFTTYNNIKEIQKTKLDSSAQTQNKQSKKYGFIDLVALFETCKKEIQKRSEQQKLENTAKRKAKNLNHVEFMQKLPEKEAKAYHDYIAYRQEKKNISAHTIKRIQNRFMQLFKAGQNMPEVVETSIRSGWIDLYAQNADKKAYSAKEKGATKEQLSALERFKAFDYEKELQKIMQL